MKTRRLFIFAVFVLTFAETGQAALINRGGGLVYDTVLNVTWLQNANLAAGSAYDDGNSATDGRMTWASAVAWAENLSLYDQIRETFWENWRLPDIKPVNGAAWNASFSYDGSTDFAFNITSPNSEMAYMFHVTLGNSSYYDPQANHQTNYGLANSSLFSNLHDYVYWSGVWGSADGGWGGAPLGFNFATGLQDEGYRLNQCYAWAVMDGDVSTVPEPGTASLLFSGLLMIVFYKHLLIKKDMPFSLHPWQ